MIKISKNKKIAIILVVILIGSFFSFMGYVTYGEKTAMENLSYSIENVSVKSLQVYVGKSGFDIIATFTVAIKFNNPTGYDTPTFNGWFEWGASTRQYSTDPIYALIWAGYEDGFGTLEATKVQAQGQQISILELSFNKQGIYQDAVNALLQGGFYMTIEGYANAKMFFGLIPVSKHFILVEPITLPEINLPDSITLP